jgi:hypothetical protein
MLGTVGRRDPVLLTPVSATAKGLSENETVEAATLMEDCQLR